MDRQKVFNDAVNGLASQEWKHSATYQDNGNLDNCLYHDPITGRKCGIGHTFPDSIYETCFERKGISHTALSPVIAYLQADVITEIGRYHVYDLSFGDMPFLADLQSCHDRSANRDAERTLQDELISFAIKYNLQLPEVLK